jgi:hypothetical protein
MPIESSYANPDIQKVAADLRDLAEYVTGPRADERLTFIHDEAERLAQPAPQAGEGAPNASQAEPAPSEGQAARAIRQV